MHQQLRLNTIKQGNENKNFKKNNQKKYTKMYSLKWISSSYRKMDFKVEENMPPERIR